MKGSREYFTGGNMIPWWVGGISLYMSMFSAWTFTGASGFVYHTGLFGFIYFFTWSLAFFLGHRITASRWRRSRVLSPVEYTRTRYNVGTQQLVGYVMVMNGLLVRGIVLTAVSKVIAATLDVPIEWVIVIGGTIILIYTLLGGLWAVAITDVVQFIILLVITLLVMPMSINAVGGLETFLNNLPELKMVHVFKGETYNIHYLIAITLVNLVMSNWMAAQRYYSVKDERDAKRVGLTCSILFLTVPILFGIPPLAAKLLWPDLSQIPFFQGKLVPEDLVYIGMVLKAVPNGLIGFFLAAMFAATMSALDTTYNIDSSIIAKDLYGKVFKPHASEDDLLKVGKISTLFLGIMAIIMSLIYCNTTYGIFNLMVTMMSLFAMPIAIPMAFGLVFKQLPRWSAMSALILGLLTSALVRFNLEWSVGPQIYATVLTTFGLLLLAEPLGRIYRKHSLYGMGTILVLVIALFSLYYTQSAADMTPLRTGLLLLAGATFMGLLIVFSRLFARETDNERMIVEKFFQNLAIPVDVAKEVYGEGKKPVSTYPVVGLICMIIGAIIIVLLITPMSAQDRWMTFAVGALLTLIGFLLYYFGGKSEKAFVEKMQQAQSSLGEGQE